MSKCESFLPLSIANNKQSSDTFKAQEILEKPMAHYAKLCLLFLPGMVTGGEREIFVDHMLCVIFKNCSSWLFFKRTIFFMCQNIRLGTRSGSCLACGRSHGPPSAPGREKSSIAAYHSTQCMPGLQWGEFTDFPRTWCSRATVGFKWL